MTTQKIPQILFNELFQHTIGFDRLQDLLLNSPNQKSSFPPYNITRNKKTKEYIITMALAGYSEDDINVEVEKNILKVSSEGILPDENLDQVLVHNGIAYRSFRLRIPLSDNMEVTKASMANGLLTITAIYKKDESLIKVIDITS
jgi:molecular chaperone IbpA